MVAPKKIRGGNSSPSPDLIGWGFFSPKSPKEQKEKRTKKLHLKKPDLSFCHLQNATLTYRLPDLECARWALADNFADLAFTGFVLHNYKFAVLDLKNGRQGSYACTPACWQILSSHVIFVIALRRWLSHKLSALTITIITKNTHILLFCGLVHLECFVYDVCHFSYPFTLYVYLLVVLFDRLQVWSIQEAETDAGLLVVKEVHMGDPEFIRRRPAKLSQVVFSKWDLVHIKKCWQRRYNRESKLIIFSSTGCTHTRFIRSRLQLLMVEHPCCGHPDRP